MAATTLPVQGKDLILLITSAGDARRNGPFLIRGLQRWKKNGNWPWKRTMHTENRKIGVSIGDVSLDQLLWVFFIRNVLEKALYSEWDRTTTTFRGLSRDRSEYCQGRANWSSCHFFFCFLCIWRNLLYVELQILLLTSSILLSSKYLTLFWVFFFREHPTRWKCPSVHLFLSFRLLFFFFCIFAVKSNNSHRWLRQMSVQNV